MLRVRRSAKRYPPSLTTTREQRGRPLFSGYVFSTAVEKIVENSGKSLATCRLIFPSTQPPVPDLGLIMDVWAEVLSKVERRVNRQCFDTWFRPIVFAGCDESAVHLTVPNENFKRLLLDNYSAV